MYAMERDDELTLLRAADPLSDVEVARDAEDALLEHARTADPSTRRHPARWVAAGALAAAAIAIAVPAAADHLFQAQTGTYGEPRSSLNTEEDDSEVIFTSAEDFVDYTTTIYPYWMPLPAGIQGDEVRIDVAMSMKAASDADADPASGAGGAHTTETGIVASFEFAGQCLWMDEYIRAHRTGDAARAAAAAVVLADAATWPEIVSTDGGGVVDSFDRIAASAAAGDVASVAADASLNCSWQTLERYGR